MTIGTLQELKERYCRFYTVRMDVLGLGPAAHHLLTMVADSAAPAPAGAVMMSPQECCDALVQQLSASLGPATARRAVAPARAVADAELAVDCRQVDLGQVLLALEQWRGECPWCAATSSSRSSRRGSARGAVSSGAGAALTPAAGTATACTGPCCHRHYSVALPSMQQVFMEVMERYG